MNIKKILLRLYCILRKYVHYCENILLFVLFILFSCNENPVEPPTIGPIHSTIDTFPVMSSDGRFVLYNHTHVIENSTGKGYDHDFELSSLWIANADGGNPHLLLKEFSSIIDWSPDNKWIVYHSSGQIFKMPVVNGSIDTTKIEQLTFNENNFNPDWDPLGQKIVYEVRHGGTYDTWRIRIMNSDGLEIAELNIPGTQGQQMPNWSPDGSRLVYNGYKIIDNDKGLYILNLQSDIVTRLTIENNSFSDHLYPKFSPDGSKIVFQSKSLETAITSIYVIDVDGKNLRKLTDGKQPSWSSDDGKIIFTRSPEGIKFGLETVYSIDVGGSNLVQLTFGPN